MAAPSDIEVQPERVFTHAEVIAKLIVVARLAHHMLDDAEVEGQGLAHVHHAALELALDDLEELPDDRPGCTMHGPARAEWALRDLFTVPADEDMAQIIYALERQERALEAHADRLMAAHDYGAEFPACDAQCMRQAVGALRGLASHNKVLTRARDTIDMLCNGLAWNIESHPTVMNQSDEEALASGRAMVAAINFHLSEEPMATDPLDDKDSVFYSREPLELSEPDALQTAAQPEAAESVEACARRIEGNHILAGSPGPLFNMGWSSALKSAAAIVRRDLAANPPAGERSPEVQSVAWTITAPDGRQWTGESALMAARAAQRDTIDPVVAMERINAMVAEETAIHEAEIAEAFERGQQSVAGGISTPAEPHKAALQSLYDACRTANAKAIERLHGIVIPLHVLDEADSALSGDRVVSFCGGWPNVLMDRLEPAEAEPQLETPAEECKRMVDEFGESTVRAATAVTDLNIKTLMEVERRLKAAIDVLAAPSASPAAQPHMLAICAALGFDPTNHHNAAKCPYCTPRPAEAKGGEQP